MAWHRPESGFPLFLLDTVLLPTESTLLHVFEDRYKAMIERCLADDEEFGIVWEGDDGPHEIGCAARITEVVERFDDGRLNIVVTGTTPIRVLEPDDSFDYPAARVERIPDDGDDVESEVADRAHRAFAQLVETATEQRPDRDRVARMAAYEMAAIVELGLNAKQGLLELRSEGARLQLITRLFETGAAMIGRAKEIGRRAQTNGRVDVRLDPERG